MFAPHFFRQPANSNLPVITEKDSLSVLIDEMLPKIDNVSFETRFVVFYSVYAHTESKGKGLSI